MEIKIKNVENKDYSIFIEEKNSKLGNIANFSVKKGVNAYCNKNCNKCYCNYMKMFNAHCKHVELNFNAVDDSIKDDILKSNIIQAISNYILLNGCDVFRFNVEGDINSNYLDIIIQIAKKNLDCKVYLYTKNFNVIEMQLHNIVTINNLTILLSIMNYNDSSIIEKFRKYDNIKFFITTRNEKERLIYFKSYNMDYFNICKNDIDKNTKCKGCKLCYDNSSEFASKFIFNEYRGIKKVKKDTIPHVALFLQTLNRFNQNTFLNSALHEALVAIFCHTTVTKKELFNLTRLVDIKIRSFSKNAKKEDGRCEKLNNGCFKITLNNMNYYKTICVLIHELLHVLVFDDGHGGKFDKYATEIEENTIFSCRGSKSKLNDINYKNSIELEKKLIIKTIDMCTTYLLNSSYDYLKMHTKNQLLMKFSNDIYNHFIKIETEEEDLLSRYTNLRSIVTLTVKNTLNQEYNNILNNINV